MSGGFVSRQGRTAQLPEQLFGIFPPVIGAADQPFGHTSNHTAASQAPASTSSRYRRSGWKKPRAKVSGDV